MLREKIAGDGPICCAISLGIDGAQHLPSSKSTLFGHAWVGRHRLACYGGPESTERSQAVRRKFVEDHHGCEWGAAWDVSAFDVEGLFLYGKPYSSRHHLEYVLRLERLSGEAGTF